MDDISVVWWNTSLYSYAPSIEDRWLKKEYSSEVYNEICLLCEDNDFIFLGECPENLDDTLEDEFNLGLQNRDLAIESLFFKSGKEEFHNAVIYRCDKYQIVDESNKDRSITTYRNIPRKRQYRVVQRVKFRAISDLNFGIEFFVVHWSKRDSCKGDQELYDKEGSAGEILSLAGSSDVDYPYKMILGDFNNEPYESTLRKMRETRSRVFAIKNEALYNPFWELMYGESGTINSPNNNNLNCDKPFFDFCLINDRFCQDFAVYRPTIVELQMDHRKDEHRPVKLELQTGNK